MCGTGFLNLVLTHIFDCLTNPEGVSLCSREWSEALQGRAKPVVDVALSYSRPGGAEERHPMWRSLGAEHSFAPRGATQIDSTLTTGSVRLRRTPPAATILRPSGAIASRRRRTYGLG